MVILLKARINFRVICSAFERILANETESLQIHFIHVSHDWVLAQKVKSVILKGMKKYKIESVMVSSFYMERWNLITKEKMVDHCKGKTIEKESVNDDLESFFEDIRLSKETTKVGFKYNSWNLKNLKFRISTASSDRR